MHSRIVLLAVGAVAVAIGGPTATTHAQTAATSGSGDSILFGSPRKARDDWSGAEQRARSPAWDSWIKGQRREVDGWLSRPRDRADLVGGWVHDYVDPDSGITEKWSQDTPEPSESGARGMRFKQAWVAKVREVNIIRMLQAARLFRVTGDAKYGDWVVSQLEMYAKAYGSWPLRTDNGRARMFKNGLDEATQSLALVDTVRTLGPRLSTQQLQLLRDNLFYPMAENLKTIGAPLTNIGLWHGVAVASIAMRFRDQAMLDYALDNPQGIRATLKSGFTTDDVWKEGSLSYNAYVANALGRLLLSASLEDQDARFAQEWKVLERLVEGPLRLRFDDGTLPTPGDGTVGLKAVDPDFLSKLYRVLPSQPGVATAGAKPSWDHLIDPAPAPGPPPTLPPVVSRDLPAVRMAVLRSGNWQAFVHYGQAVANHAQEEALSYELHDGQVAISIDSGTVAYGSPYHRDYFSRGPGNNVPLVDGTGQQQWGPGSVSKFEPTSNLLAVQHSRYRNSAGAEREFRVAGDGFSETTRLRAVDGKQHRLGAVLHTPCDIAGDSGLARADGEAVPQNSGTAYWKDLVAYSAGSHWELRLRCKGGNYVLSLDGPATQKVFVGQAPAVPLPARQPVVYYETTGTEATFKLVIRAAS